MPYLSTSEIDSAIPMQDWQKVRLSMKGTSTRSKLDTCAKWLRTRNTQSSLHQREIQIQNYLNALARGGQIAAIPDKTAPLDEQIRTARILK